MHDFFLPRGVLVKVGLEAVEDGTPEELSLNLFSQYAPSLKQCKLLDFVNEMNIHLRLNGCFSLTMDMSSRINAFRGGVDGASIRENTI